MFGKFIQCSECLKFSILVFIPRLVLSTQSIPSMYQKYMCMHSDKLLIRDAVVICVFIVAAPADAVRADLSISCNIYYGTFSIANASRLVKMR